MKVWKEGDFWYGRDERGKVLDFVRKDEALLWAHGFGCDQAAELRYIMSGKKISAIEKAMN